MVFGAAFFKYASLQVGYLSPFLGSFSRVLVNMLVAIGLGYAIKKGSILGKNKKLLFVWGVLGAVTVTLFFQSLAYVGVGVASFLLTTSGALMVFLSPLISKKMPPPLQISAAILCVCGALCLSPSSVEMNSFLGIVFGLLAALSAAGAYLIVGSKMKDESPVSLMFYWSVVGVAVHFFQFPFMTIDYNLSTQVLWLVFLASFLASVGQYWVNMSYQCKGNWVIGLVSYLGCITGLLIDQLWLGIAVEPMQMFGVFVIMTANGILLLPKDLKLTTLGKRSV